MMKVPAAHFRLVIITYSQPHLRLISFLQIVGFVAQLVVSRRQSDDSIDLPVLVQLKISLIGIKVV